MKEAEKYEKIERYLNGQMSDAEMERFEQSMGKDAALRNDVQLHRDLAQTLKGDQVHRLRATLKEVDQKWTHAPAKKEGKVRLLRPITWLAIAATMALLVVSYFVFQPARPSHQDLFAENFAPYPMVLNQRSGTPVDSILQAAIDAYERGSFVEATQQFQRLQDLDSNNFVYRFYQGLSFLANQEAGKAISILIPLVNGKSKLKEQSQWYLALAYLQIKDF
ncbi:MAG: hypothetical protein AAF985_20465, partial [Bacteroidota bacterium]